MIIPQDEENNVGSEVLRPDHIYNAGDYLPINNEERLPPDFKTAWNAWDYRRNLTLLFLLTTSMSYCGAFVAELTAALDPTPSEYIKHSTAAGCVALGTFLCKKYKKNLADVSTLYEEMNHLRTQSRIY